MRWMLLVMCAACSGKLGNTDRFFDAGLAFKCEKSAEEIQAEIVMPKCATSGCHNSASKVSGLDLESPDAASAMFGTQAACHGELLIDDRTPFAGYVFDKLIDEKPKCGTRMPYKGAALSAAEVDCLHKLLAPPIAIEVDE